MATSTSSTSNSNTNQRQSIEHEEPEWKVKSNKAKKLHRPRLKNWECDGFYGIKFDSYKALLENKLTYFEQFVPRVFESSNNSSRDVVDACTSYHPSIPVVVDVRHMSPHDFRNNIEANRLPALIQNIPTHDPGHGTTNKEKVKPWKALEKWTFDALEHNVELRERTFKCGEDDDGCSIRLKLKHFLQYTQHNHDDSPLYIFDSKFDEDRIAKSLLDDYRVPSYFDEDLFQFVGEKRRPPYRWFLIGPERSGTTVHIDPLSTSAWNTLIRGQKRWVLFPPHVPKRIAKGSKLVFWDDDGEDDEPVHYFTMILPRIKQQALQAQRIMNIHKHHVQGNNDPNGSCTCTSKEIKLMQQYHNFYCYEFTQNPNETVFIPNGWWHAVLNITHTVGITQNFCSSQNFDQVWRSTRTGRKKMSHKWLCALEEQPQYAHLAKRAKTLNEMDHFVMKYGGNDDNNNNGGEDDDNRDTKKKKKKSKTKKNEEQHHEVLHVAATTTTTETKHCQSRCIAYEEEEKKDCGR